MTSSEPTPLFDRIALIGAGLIGSSLARVARRDQHAHHLGPLDALTQFGKSDFTRQRVPPATPHHKPG